MSQNHRRAAPAIDPTKKSSLFEVPFGQNPVARFLLVLVRERHRICVRQT
jgi:hypothetical protein